MATVFYSSASELATLTNTFDVDGAPTNPTTVTLTVTSPSGVVTTPSPSNPSPGVYSVDVACDEDGEWQYLWVGTGAATDAAAGTWTVFETDLGKLYCPVQALKSRLGISHSNVDYELHAACFAASRWVEQYCQRHFWRTTSTTARTFAADDGYRLRLPAFSDLTSVTTLKTDIAGDGSFATTWAVGDYRLWPWNPDAAPERQPYTQIRAVGGQSFPVSYGSLGRVDLVEITGVWGWTRVPWGVRQAALILAADAFKLKDAPFGVEGEGEFTVAVGENRRALRYLDPYRRFPVMVA